MLDVESQKEILLMNVFEKISQLKLVEASIQPRRSEGKGSLTSLRGAFRANSGLT